jgi:hypothetical protein
MVVVFMKYGIKDIADSFHLPDSYWDWRVTPKKNPLIAERIVYV